MKTHLRLPRFSQAIAWSSGRAQRVQARALRVELDKRVGLLAALEGLRVSRAGSACRSVIPVQVTIESWRTVR